MSGSVLLAPAAVAAAGMVVTVTMWLAALRTGPWRTRLPQLVRDLLSVVSPVPSDRAPVAFKHARLHHHEGVWTVAGITGGAKVTSPLREALAVCAHSPHRAPRAWCTCGFHGWRHRTQLQGGPDGPQVVALQVSLSGLVHENSRGFRASRQDVISVTLPRCVDGVASQLLSVSSEGEVTAVCHQCIPHESDISHAFSITAATGVPVFDANQDLVVELPKAAGVRHEAIGWLRDAIEGLAGDLVALHRRRQRIAAAVVSAGDVGVDAAVELLATVRPARVYDDLHRAGELLETLPREVALRLIDDGGHLGFVWRRAAGLVIDDLVAYRDLVAMVHGPVADVVVSWWAHMGSQVRRDVPVATLESLISVAVEGGRPLVEALGEGASWEALQAVNDLELQLRSESQA